MKFEYPTNNISDGNAQSNLGSTNKFGFYPLSRFNSWHGGYHVEGQNEEIKAIAEGKIIAYRMPLENTKETIGPDSYFYSNGFVLIQHEYKSSKGQELTFFSLYMHLLPKTKVMAGHHLVPFFLTKSKGQVKGLNARVDKTHVSFVIPKEEIVTLDNSTIHNWNGSAKYKQISYKDKHNTVWTSVHIAIDTKYVEAAGSNQYKIITEEDTGFPAEAYSFDKEKKYDQVVSCNIPVKAGELIGYAGQYAFEKQPSYFACHIEVFTADDPTSFLRDVKNDGEKEKHYVKLKAGAVLKRAYPWVIPGDSKVKVTAGENYSQVELVSVTKTVLHADLEAKGEVEGKTRYYPKEGAAFNRVNHAFGGILKKDSALVLVNKVVVGTVQKREVTYTPASGSESYWVPNANVPPGETETRDLASTITELYKTKPDPDHLQDQLETEEIVSKKAFKQTKDPNKKTWYYVITSAKEGWIKEDDAHLEQISAYNWEAFGFNVVRDTEDQYLYDPKNPPKFLKDLWAQLDTNRDQILNSHELRAAFSDAEMSRKLSRMVCQHTSEWAWNERWATYQAKIKELYKEGITKEEDGKLKKQLEAHRDLTLAALEKRLHALCFWNEVKPVVEVEKEEVEKQKENVFTEIKDFFYREVWLGDKATVAAETTAAKPPVSAPKLFPVDPKVYHFHPIAFVEQMRRVMIKPFIDWKFISKQEGGTVLTGYAPHKTVGGAKVAIGQSGVTIAAGFDIGQHSESEIEKIFKNNEELLTLYKPYAAKKRDTAIDFLEDNPLTITQDQALETNKLIHESQKETVIKHYNSFSPTLEFEELPTGVQTVVMSISFQYGPKASALNSMWQALTTQDYDQLYNFFDNKSSEGMPYCKRREAEKNYLKDHLNF